MLVRPSWAPVLYGGLRRKTQLFSGTLYMAASSKTPPHQSKGSQKFKTPLQVPVFPGSSPLCHHTNSENPSDTTSFHSVLGFDKSSNFIVSLRHVRVIIFILAYLHPPRSPTREAVCRSSGKYQARRLPGVYPEYSTTASGRRSNGDPQYLKLYRDFIHEYERLEHMKAVVAENDNSEIAYYMPHHGILRPEKSTTKLRVVFNATNPTRNELSLNSIQHNGGLVQNDVFTIMIKFREHPYAFTADVKMYRMILIHENQQPLLRILWKESPEDPVKIFEMKTVTWHAILRENFYMDDVLCSAASLMEAKALKNQLSGILKKGGMKLHK
ncbi:uncharacterized protein TNCV_3866971 [Trichonephila clavipes]|nr:uncharacterized protein TNCV_3866971 [Trichonephila clavipes]